MLLPAYPAAQQSADEAKGYEEDANRRRGVLEKECQTDAKEGERQTDDGLVDVIALVVGQGTELVLYAAHHVETREKYQSAADHQQTQHADGFEQIERGVVEDALVVEQRNDHSRISARSNLPRRLMSA